MKFAFHRIHSSCFMPQWIRSHIHEPPEWQIRNEKINGDECFARGIAIDFNKTWISNLKRKRLFSETEWMHPLFRHSYHTEDTRNACAFAFCHIYFMLRFIEWENNNAKHLDRYNCQNAVKTIMRILMRYSYTSLSLCDCSSNSIYAPFTATRLSIYRIFRICSTTLLRSLTIDSVISYEECDNNTPSPFMW